MARWRGQYEQHRVRDLPLFDSLGDWLEANRPAEGRPAILHGDFHLDNCLITAGPPARVSAIIDWELATVGDPWSISGCCSASGAPTGPRPIAMERVQALSRLPGAPGRRALADYYTSLTGRSTQALAFYMVLALFKLAAIVEGAYARYLGRDVDSPYARALGADVPRLLRDAAASRGNRLTGEGPLSTRHWLLALRRALAARSRSRRRWPGRSSARRRSSRRARPAPRPRTRSGRERRAA